MLLLPSPLLHFIFLLRECAQFRFQGATKINKATNSTFRKLKCGFIDTQTQKARNSSNNKNKKGSPKKMDPFMMPDIRLLCCQTALALFTYRFTSLHRCRGCPMPFVYFNLLRLSNDLHCCIFVLRPSKALRQFVAIYMFIVSFSFGILSGPVKDTHIYFLCWVNI